MAFVQRLLVLFGEVPGQRFEHVFEHRAERVVQAVAEHAIGFGLAHGGAHFGIEFGIHRRLPLGIPHPECHQMAHQPVDRIAQRPLAALGGRAILARIVRSRMALGAIGEMFDQRRPGVAARAIGRPVHRSIDRQRIVAIDAQAGNAIADRARGKSRALGAGKARKARNRPLVVDQIEHHRRVVDRGKSQRRVEIALGARSFADKRARDAAVVFDRTRHRPAHRLRILRGQIARNRKQRLRARRIHDRQLPAFELVGAVRENLVDHLGKRIAARDKQALLAIAGKHHVVGRERQRSGDRGRFFAGRFHVEAGLALPLCAHHPRIERAGERHQPQHADQRCRIEPRVPPPVRAIVFTQHADQIEAQRMRGLGRARLVGARLRAGRGDCQMAVIDRIAGAIARLGHVQRQSRQIAFGHPGPAPTTVATGDSAKDGILYRRVIILRHHSAVNRPVHTATGAARCACGW